MLLAMDPPAAKRPASESQGDVSRRPVVDAPTLPYAKAFVVQFTADTDARLERVEGRIEHLQTGRRSRFASAEQLLACVTALLADSAENPAETRRSAAPDSPPRREGA